MHSVPPSAYSDPYPSTYLEKSGIVESWEVKGKPLAQHPVHPALQDGRHAEPVQRELGTTPRTNECCGCLRLRGLVCLVTQKESRCPLAG